jgi:hypothetical protein
LVNSFSNTLNESLFREGSDPNGSSYIPPQSQNLFQIILTVFQLVINNHLT